MMSKFPCLLVPLQVDDDHELYEGDEGDGEASQDPDVDGLEVGGAGGIVKDVVAHGHDAQHRRDPQRHSTRNLNTEELAKARYNDCFVKRLCGACY